MMTREQTNNYLRKWRKRNKEHVRLWYKKWHSDNRDKLKIYNKNRRLKNPEKFRLIRHRSYIKIKYRISYDNFNSMLEKQKGRCAICNNIMNRDKCIDHCHKTNEVRGLLCRNCNFMIGYSKDSIAILYKAIKYLNNTQDCR